MSEAPAIHGHTSQESKLLLRGAERLVTRYGDKADLVAAHLADSSFTAGDMLAGDRWAKIFRILARSHTRGAAKPPPVSADLN